MQDTVACPLTTIIGSDVYSTSVHMVNGSHSVDENLKIDTGSDTVLLSEQSSEQLHLMDISQSSIHTFYGDFTVGKGPLTTLSFPAASITLNNQTVSYTKEPMPTGFAGDIGRDVLSQFQVLFDFGAKIMYLKPNPPSTPAVAAPTAPSPSEGSH